MALYSLAWTDAAPACLTGGAVSVGNFDGVHRGHGSLVRVLKNWAVRVNGPAVAVTFDPPPVALLNPASLQPPLTTIRQRSELLHALGIEHVVVLRADSSLLALSAGSFIEDVIQKQLHARAIIEGGNFRFGRNREGDCALLETLEYRSNINFEEVPIGPEAISSSKIRAALKQGDIQLANDLLGRAYSITGTVMEGVRRGRTLGVPTANLDQMPVLIPAAGVYAARVKVTDKVWPAAVNVGPNPTFGEHARKVEVHLIGFEGDLYGQMLEVSFIKRLRDTKPFPSVDALKQQLQIDIADAMRVLA